MKQTTFTGKNGAMWRESKDYNCVKKQYLLAINMNMVLFLNTRVK